MQADAIRIEAEHPAVTPEMVVQLARKNDSDLQAVAGGGCSMRNYVATIQSGDPFTAAGLDCVSRSAYDLFVDAMVRRGLELRSDYLGGVPILIVQAAPKGSR